MRRAPIAVVVAAAAATAAITANGSAQAPGGRTLTFYESHDGAIFGLVDSAPRSKRHGERASISPGDIFTFEQPILDESQTKRIGSSHGSCVATKGGRSFPQAVFQCTATYDLQDGSLALAAAFRPASRKAVIAVVGGTGAYEGARGSGTSTEGRAADKDVFHLLP